MYIFVALNYCDLVGTTGKSISYSHFHSQNQLGELQRPIVTEAIIELIHMEIMLITIAWGVDQQNAWHSYGIVRKTASVYAWYIVLLHQAYCNVLDMKTLMNIELLMMKFAHRTNSKDCCWGLLQWRSREWVKENRLHWICVPKWQWQGVVHGDDKV